MTIDELRAFCLSLPGTHEKETWGDAEHAGDVTFRVKDKIYVITGPEAAAARASARRSSSRPTCIAAFPESVDGRRRTSAGSAGSASSSRARRARCRGRPRRRSRSAWRRTAPKAMRARARGGAAMSADRRSRPPAHQRHRRRAPDRRGVRPGARRGSRRPDPLRRRRVPGRRRELRRSPAPPSTPAPTCSRSACRTRTRSPTARPSSGRRRARSPPARRSTASLALRPAASPRPARTCPLVPMGYANQLIGGGDGRDRARALAAAGRGRRHRRGPHARRGGAVRGGRRRGGDRGRLPRRADDGARAPRRRRRAERRVPLLRVAGRGHRGAHVAAARRCRRLVREVKAVSPVPVAVGFGVSKPAHVRAIAKAGADGVIVALGARRRPRPRWPRRRGARQPRRPPARGDGVMTRQPGDPAPGDRDFGPLGGLFDDLHHASRRRHLDQAAAERRHTTGLDADRRTLVERLRRLLGR